jgi:hypothetical protein
MIPLRTPLIVAVRAAYWAPVGLVWLPACDAWRVVRDSLAVVGAHARRARRER